MANNFVEEFLKFVEFIKDHKDLMTGGEDDTVDIEGVTQPTFRKDIKDRITEGLAEIKALVAGRAVFETYAEMIAAGAPVIPAGQTTVAREVLNDNGVDSEGRSLNGLYVWDVSASSWVLSSYSSSSSSDVIGGEVVVSLFDGGSFKDGASGWNVSGTTTTAWDTEGLTITKDGVFQTPRIFKIVSGGIPLIAGRKYAFFADFDIEGNRSVSNVDSVLWRPFILQAEDTKSATQWPGKRLEVGDTGSPLSYQIAASFVSTETATRGNPYVDFQGAETENSQAVVSMEFKATYRTFFIVDLGDSSSPFYSLDDATLSSLIYGLDTPFYPESELLINKSISSITAVKAEKATTSETALFSITSESASALKSTYEGKRIITLGHSLVSQVGWQPYLKAMLGLSGYSTKGITGGTLQPKPAESIVGMYSRAYMAEMITDMQNFDEVSTRGFDSIKDASVATIFWLGANDGITDIGNSPYKRLYLDGDFLATLTAKSTGLSVGDFTDTVAGMAGTVEDDYFTTDGNIAGWKILYLNRDNLGAQIIYHYPSEGTAYTVDRIMTVAEQDELEARNTAQGAAAFLSEPLSTGFVVTYEGLYHTMIANYMLATEYHKVPEHRFFIVREPQAFWAYDGTLDWPQGHYEKNEVHKKVADYWGIPLIDQWGESGINLATRGWFLQNEAGGDLLIHHTEKGGYVCADLVRKRMLEFPPLVLSELYGADLDFPTLEDDLGPWNVDNIS